MGAPADHRGGHGKQKCSIDQRPGLAQACCSSPGHQSQPAWRSDGGEVMVAAMTRRRVAISLDRTATATRTARKVAFEKRKGRETAWKCVVD